MFTIESPLLKATIQAKGAELTSLVHKETGIDHMWSGDPAVWGKHSPILFPIVGSLKDNTYYYQGQAYQLSRHGFARELPFAVETHTADAITFLLKHSAETLKVFPFAFELRLTYTAIDDTLGLTYQVSNPAKEPMYFSIGAHPAFKVPLAPDTAYTDYYLEFDQPETAGRWHLETGGLLASASTPLLDNTNLLPLRKDLFYKDALVLKGLRSTQVTLRSASTAHGLRMDFPGFPFFGIWAAVDADFVCLEPWCGITDSAQTSQQLPEKEGINRLAGGESFRRTCTLQLF
ncbi:MAG: aldose 1-epimerase family protein [Candidatus Pseudobacter hemicellulosilyticus]|uniref:Aldose 1-epimerase family protein n=1 Tax=Candidatus Pseudobacter hemicellulosilyticus TaxID=3121375 RepID=A0AAJ6BEK4_9BACT|nr:MAG: aldose 1-epimerase family protein [Pseudobacter sp.]